MNICFIAWERFGVGGVSRVLTRIMNALCREHEISVYCLRRWKARTGWIWRTSAFSTMK